MRIEDRGILIIIIHLLKSEYEKKCPKTQTADQPMEQRGRDIEYRQSQHNYSRKHSALSLEYLMILIQNQGKNHPYYGQNFLLVDLQESLFRLRVWRQNKNIKKKL